MLRVESPAGGGTIPFRLSSSIILMFNDKDNLLARLPPPLPLPPLLLRLVRRWWQLVGVSLEADEVEEAVLDRFVVPCMGGKCCGWWCCEDDGVALPKLVLEDVPVELRGDAIAAKSLTNVFIGVRC